MTRENSLAAQVRAKGDLALFLDVDGVLVDIAPRPADAVAAPGLANLLHDVKRRLDGALAIVSGRQIVEIDGLLAPLRLPAAGVHGAEIREIEEGPIRSTTPPLPDEVVGPIRALAGLDPGVIVEIKGAVAAVHYRLARNVEAELARRMRELARRSEHPLELRPGRMVIEVARPDVTKGWALRFFMSRPPFAGRRPVMIGDDFVDLKAFEAAQALDGVGLRVAGEFFSRAQADFSGTTAVREWLTSLV